jgi:hypothetical protein
LLYDALRYILCIAANGKWGKEYCVELKTSERPNELTTFSPETGKKQIRIIEMNLEEIFFALSNTTKLLTVNEVQ